MAILPLTIVADSAIQSSNPQGSTGALGTAFPFASLEIITLVKLKFPQEVIDNGISNYTLNSATWNYYNSSVNDGGSVNIFQLDSLDEDWTEAEGDYYEKTSGVNWTTVTPGSMGSWNSVEGAALITYDHPITTDSTESMDIAVLIQKMLTDAKTEMTFAWRLNPSVVGSAVDAKWYSKEGNTLAHSFEFDATYVAPPVISSFVTSGLVSPFKYRI